MALDGAQRMMLGHGAVEVEDGEKLGLSLRIAAQGFQTRFNPTRSNSQGTFSIAW